MIRKLMMTLGVVGAGFLATGCGGGSSGAPGKETIKDLKEKAAEAGKEMKEKAAEASKEVKEKASEAGKEVKEKASEAGKEVKEAAVKAGEAAKAAFIKPIQDALPKIEEKMKGLSGDSLAKAKVKFDEIKKLLADFDKAGPDKWESLKEGVTKAFEELKKLVAS